MCTLNLKVIYKMNSEQNKRVAVNAAGDFVHSIENVAGGLCF